MRAALRERLGHRPAETARRAGDQRNLPGQIEHRCLLGRSRVIVNANNECLD